MQQSFLQRSCLNLTQKLSSVDLNSKDTESFHGFNEQTVSPSEVKVQIHYSEDVSILIPVEPPPPQSLEKTEILIPHFQKYATETNPCL